MLTSTTADPAATRPRVMSCSPIESRPADPVAHFRDDGHDAPVHGQPARHAVAIGRGKNRRVWPERGQPPRSSTVAGHGDDGLRVATVRQRDCGFAEGLGVVVAQRLRRPGQLELGNGFGVLDDRGKRLHGLRGERTHGGFPRAA